MLAVVFVFSFVAGWYMRAGYVWLDRRYPHVFVDDGWELEDDEYGW